MNFKSVLKIIYVALVQILILLCVFARTNNEKDTSTKNSKPIAFAKIQDEVITEGEKVETNKKLLNVADISSIVSSNYIVTSGVLKNNSEFVCSDFRIIIEYLDDDSNLLETDHALLLNFSNSVSPNSNVTFQALTKLSADNLNATQVKVYVESGYSISK